MLLGFAIFFCVLHIGESFKSATIVGSGPVGLASALVLAKRHGYNVTVLEAAERTDVYDPRKGYPFLIGERGQKVTNLFPSVQQALQERGVAVEGPTKIISIPADADELLNLEPKEITIFRPKGERFWIRRHEFTRIWLDAASAEENISVVNGVYCKSIKRTSESEITVCVDSSSPGVSNSQEYTSSLVLAADGMNSAVREALSQSPSPLEGWKNSKPAGFRPRRWLSPSSGLKFKTLHMNPDATIPVGDGTQYRLPFNTQTFFAFRSVFKSPKTAISLGILPSREVPSRAMNVIRLPDHDIWKIRDGNSLREWFSKAFPRLDFTKEPSLITQKEFDRFASNDGLTLPPVQYSPELHVASTTGEAAVLILGDAAHTFPPDLGEGVNSGLEDVFALDQALGQNENVGDMALAYATERKPEAKAIARIATFGAPFQYNQSGGMLTLQKTLWSLNFFGRLLLNKLTFGLTPPQLAIQISETNLPYSTIWKRANILTISLWAVATSILAVATGIPSKLQPLLLPRL